MEASQENLQRARRGLSRATEDPMEALRDQGLVLHQALVSSAARRAKELQPGTRLKDSTKLTGTYIHLLKPLGKT